MSLSQCFLTENCSILIFLTTAVQTEYGSLLELHQSFQAGFFILKNACHKTGETTL